MLISVNPMAGRKSRRRAVDQLVEQMKAHGLHCQVVTELAELSQLAAEWLGESRLRAVVGAGGDGTAAEIVNRTPPGTPLVMLPQGTENLLAKYVGSGHSAKAVCETIRHGVLARLDAGQAVTRDGEGNPVPRIFLLMASCGMDADVVHRLAAHRTGHISHLSYAGPIWQSVRNYSFPELRAEWTNGTDGQSVLRARWLFLFNLPCYAWGLKFTRHATGFDGRFDLCALRRGSLWQGLRYLWAVWWGRLHRLQDCTSQQVTSLKVESDEPVPCQLDGDPGGFLPLELEVAPRRLTLLTPMEWARNQGLPT